MNAVIKVLRKALDADPSDWESRHALIESYLGEGLQDEARLLLHEIEALPHDEASLIAAAQCYAIAGSPGDGRGILEPVLAANPGNSEAHLALASIAHLEGDSKTAMRHYITATSLDPGITSPELDAAYGDIVAPIPTKSAPVAEPEPVVEPEPEVVESLEVEPEPEIEAEPLTATVVVEEDEVREIPVLAEEKPEAPADPELEDPESAPEETVETVEALESDVEVPEPEPEPEFEAEPAEVPDTKTAPVPLLLSKAKKKKTVPGMETVKLSAAVQALRDKADSDPDITKIKSSLSDSDEFDDDEGEFDEEPLSEEEAELEELSHELKVLHDEVALKRKWAMRRDKAASLAVTLLIHVGAIVLLGIVVISVPRDVPPQLIASVSNESPDEKIEQVNVQRTQIKPTTNAATVPNIISSQNASPLALASADHVGMGEAPSFGVEFAPSMAFGDAKASMTSKMMFGQEMEGEVLGVILDVSGSMAEYLPIVIREVDKNFKNAPIVYVNHAGILGVTKGTEIYPIVKEEVIPHWPREWAKGSSPFWFLWHDLPRKAPQRTVDRLIGTFKSRVNMFIARGGNNRIGAAAEFLINEECDSLYIFSDFEDFVDEEYCLELGQKLGRNKVRAYVQPAAATTEHFATVAKKVANRSKGRSMPPLTDILRPADDTPAPIMVAVEKETPVPEGVNFATPRDVRKGDGVFYYRWHSWWHEKYSPDILEVIEYPNFDIEIRGPEARAYIYLKNKDGYIGNPIIFGYHSQKPYLDERDERWHTRKRTFLRSIEPPTLEDGEFTWRMMLEDEIEFKVIFWFKEDSMTATYMAEKPPNGEGDGAFIYFVVPPVARESKDLYYSVDFPDGLSLDDLRLAMTNNTANFYLPAQAEDRLGVSWSRLGFGRRDNICPYNIIYRDLPQGVREVNIGGPSFGPRKLNARTTSNNLLLSTGNRADLELWEGFSCRLVRPGSLRERISKLEAIKFTVE